jgi:dethiobiotin synthetase
MKSIGIIGIHTEIGKTVTSAVIAEALGCDYWKPIQAGELDNSDTAVVKSLVSNTQTVFHPEAFRLQLAMSPHAAADREKKEIELNAIKLPITNNRLIVETAGGLLSPINYFQTNLDLIMHLNLPVIIVSNTYLGSINHTMLTIQVLKQNKIEIKGLIFNGEKNIESENFILLNGKVNYLGNIYKESVNKAMIANYAEKLKSHLEDLF